MSDSMPLVPLIDYNLAVLRQAERVLDLFADHRLQASYAAVTGPHVRHIIEHYDALLSGCASGTIDYDARARDPGPEREHSIARARLHRIALRLMALTAERTERLLNVAQYAGLEGECRVLAPSCMRRELLFVASHAIHHFAVLKPSLEAGGIQLPEGFGKAPATVRHQRSQQTDCAA